MERANKSPDHTYIPSPHRPWYYKSNSSVQGRRTIPNVFSLDELMYIKHLSNSGVSEGRGVCPLSILYNISNGSPVKEHWRVAGYHQSVQCSTHAVSSSISPSDSPLSLHHSESPPTFPHTPHKIPFWLSSVA